MSQLAKHVVMSHALIHAHWFPTLYECINMHPPFHLPPLPDSHQRNSLLGSRFEFLKNISSSRRANLYLFVNEVSKASQRGENREMSAFCVAFLMDGMAAFCKPGSLKAYHWSGTMTWDQDLRVITADSGSHFYSLMGPSTCYQHLLLRALDFFICSTCTSVKIKPLRWPPLSNVL